MRRVVPQCLRGSPPTAEFHPPAIAGHQPRCETMRPTPLLLLTVFVVVACDATLEHFGISDECQDVDVILPATHSASVAIGDSIPLRAAVYDRTGETCLAQTNAAIEWRSSNSSRLEVRGISSGEGWALGRSAGAAELEARHRDSGRGGKVSVQVVGTH